MFHQTCFPLTPVIVQLYYVGFIPLSCWSWPMFEYVRHFDECKQKCCAFFCSFNWLMDCYIFFRDGIDSLTISNCVSRKPKSFNFINHFLIVKLVNGLSFVMGEMESQPQLDPLILARFPVHHTVPTFTM